MKEICLVHLVRAHNGKGPFVRFLDSYREYPGGIDHDLLIVFKGFDNPQDLDEYRKLLDPIDHLAIETSDEGLDISAYFGAFNRFSGHYRYFCFTNSFSEILDPDWLKKLHDHIILPNVGLVGATGSWQGLGIKVPNHSLGTAIKSKILASNRPESTFHGMIYIIKGIWRHIVFSFYFSRFPNYHLRTNAFMISTEDMKKLENPVIKSKIDAYKFESGKHGLTRQILSLHKRVLVVGRDGIGYGMGEWNKSRTFWQYDQENLLVSDNQTREYQNGTLERRRYLSFSAWGSEALGET